MRTLIAAIVFSLVLHGILFALANRLEIKPRSEKKSQRVKMKVVEKKKPKPKPKPKPVEKKPEPKKPEPKKAKPKPKPKKKPKVQKRAPVKKEPTKPSEPKPSEEPPPKKPKPPPMGFSVSMESTVVGGGVAVTAVEGGGNMFANPNDKTLKPGQKTTERVPPASGKGKGTGSGGEEVTPPVFLTRSRKRSPEYPEAARQANIEGQVVLRVYVGISGRVERVKVVKKLGYGCEEAAIEHAKKKWRFKPATRGGTPIGMWIPVPVTFVLDR